MLRRVIFELRETSRTIENQRELIDAVAQDDNLSAAVHWVSLARMPVAEQIRLVATSTGLAGVHGAGLSFIAFLPVSEDVHCSVLEIHPRRMNRQPNHAWFDYPRWAAMNDVEHLRITRQNDTEACVMRCAPCSSLASPDPERSSSRHDSASPEEC